MIIFMGVDRWKIFKRKALAAAFAAAARLCRAVIKPYPLRETFYKLDSPKWPKEMPELKIALAADLHVGCLAVGLKRLDSVVKALNDMKADIILLPGDFLTATGPGPATMDEYIEPEKVASALKNLHAPLGVYATLGNHDWGCDGPGMWRALENAGIHVLENDAVHVKSLQHDFWIAGLADDSARKPDWKKIEGKITDAAPVILLSHDPATFLEKTRRPVVTLSGHMHGGAVNLPLIGPIAPCPSRAGWRYTYGHIVEDGCDLIVTSGVGTSTIPIRLNARPELVSLKIKPA